MVSECEIYLQSILITLNSPQSSANIIPKKKLLRLDLIITNIITDMLSELIFYLNKEVWKHSNRVRNAHERASANDHTACPKCGRYRILAIKLSLLAMKCSAFPRSQRSGTSFKRWSISSGRFWFLPLFDGCFTGTSVRTCKLVRTLDSGFLCVSGRPLWK